MSTKQLEKLETTVDVPEGVTVTLNKHMLQVQGPLGKTYKNFKKIPVGIQFLMVLKHGHLVEQVDKHLKYFQALQHPSDQ